MSREGRTGSPEGDNPDQVDLPTIDENEEKDGNYERPFSVTKQPELQSAHLARTPVMSEKSEESESAILITELLDSDYPQKKEEEEESDEIEEDQSGSDRGSEELEDFKTVNIQTDELSNDDEDLWDTDLEIDDEGGEHDPTGRAQYRSVCDQLGVVPISYFIRHITEPTVTMRYHGLGPIGAKAIALVLRDNVTLEHLDIDGNWIGGEGGRAIARMLEENDYITEVSLADNRLGSLGARCICKMIQSNAGLRQINLSDNNFGDADTEYFIECLEQNKYLRDLNLSKNRFGQIAGEMWGPAIASNDTLESLDLSWNHLRLKGGIAVARGLQENVRLKTFRVAWNGLGPECGVPFADALANNSAVQELDLSGNRLDMKAASAISKSLLSNEEIKILRMGNNHITTSGAVALVTAINNNESSSLQELDLTDVPVEYEFLRVVEDIRLKRPDFRVINGPVLRSGNTLEDIGKPAIDPYRKKEPVMVLNEHIVVNDMRLLDVLKRYDPDNSFSVTAEEFLAALDELAVPYDRTKLEQALEKVPRGKMGKIYFGDFYEQQNRPMSSRSQRTEVKENCDQ
ncbi:leucine-rich repeat-containing protein 74B-like [Liolophura sinensis]|uniref:leucine-rich repeat-containing protein 74B-like n=1 Tax=Liolophura sinensis TaxID=3198878 RepID=UPI003158FA8B